MVAAVPHEERALHAGDVREAPLDGGGGDRLPPGVLVDVLDAVDDLEVAARPPHEHVAGGEPALLARGRRRVVEVSADVGAGDLEFADRAEAGADPGKRKAHRTVLVLARRRHRDPAGALGHAEAAAQLDAVPLEEAEHRRVEVARGGEPPAQAVAHDRAHGARALGVARREAALAQLRPAPRDPDEAGRPHAGQRGGERLEGRVPREHVGAAPEEHPEHLEVAAEGVEERQVAQQRLVDADGREGRRAGEALRDERRPGVDDALRQARAARGEHHRGRLVEGRPRVRLERALDLGRRDLGHRLGEPGVARAAQRVLRVEHEDAAARVEPGALEPPALVLPGHHRDVELHRLEHDAEAVEVGVGVERRHGDAVDEAGEVDAGRVEAVRGEDEHARAALGAEDHRRRARDAAGDRLVAPLRGARLGRVTEEDAPGVLGHALLEQALERVLRGADRGERRLGPALARGAGAEGLQVRRAPRGVEEVVPERRRNGGAGERRDGRVEKGLRLLRARRRRRGGVAGLPGPEAALEVERHR